MRLDSFLTEKGFFPTKTKAAQAVKRGEVFVGGVRQIKPSASVCGTEPIEIRAQKNFVSAGGYKLDKALDDFKIDCKDLTFADVGASTGGFTDALLKRGASLVYAVDVGKDLLDESLKNDERVVAFDGVNARYLKKEDFPKRIDAAVVDCSFISLKLVLPALKEIVDDGGFIVALIKPQFECGEKNLTKSGIVRSERAQKEAVLSIYDYCVSSGLSVVGFTTAPLYKKKNVEYLIYLRFVGESIKKEILLDTIEESINRWKNL